MNIFSARLKWLREKAELTQKQVADHVGMSPQGYGKIEKGDREPNLEVLASFPSLLGESVDFMIGVTSETRQIGELKREINRLSELIHAGQKQIFDSTYREQTHEIILTSLNELLGNHIKKRLQLEKRLEETIRKVPFHNYEPIPKGALNETKNSIDNTIDSTKS